MLVSLVSTFYYTKQSNQLAAKTQLIELVDKVFTLSAERQSLMLKGDKLPYQEIANIQLQMKHLLFEIDLLANIQKFSQSQNRLIADAFEDLLFFDYAQKYWNKVFEDPFAMPEMEAEYNRRYGQFLYKIGDFTHGELAFKKSLLLSNDSDSRIYINFQTYTNWASLEYEREIADYALSTNKGENVSFPKFKQVYALLGQTKPLLNLFKSYGFYENAIRQYNEVFSQIETEKKANMSPKQRD